jgi:hypothetical protein
VELLTQRGLGGSRAVSPQVRPVPLESLICVIVGALLRSPDHNIPGELKDSAADSH